ncbi:MAG: hypothetical protein F6K37_42310 [Moorea sp. SIO4E2]|uniref:hypothetical protein n=1 Tax=Moorena sp. SIO4E2 TaxID=2607826 RepID=UPI0013B8171E|nr:hypothetical protein [Moorena sp. SIO4E2]NEQ12240.1 hypothetical protein [Moorena sp. SIO4E2]
MSGLPLLFRYHYYNGKSLLYGCLSIIVNISLQTLFEVSYQLSALSYQLSAISYQLSAISYQLLNKINKHWFNIF